MIRIGIAVVVFWLTACAPVSVPLGAAVTEPEFTDDAFTASDGTRLPARAWKPETDPPKAVILALHGFNDYSYFFDDPGDFLRARGVASFAYDQRGFGTAPNPGSWAGVAAYARDAADAVRALKRRFPGTPIFLQGTSMGGAVAMVAAGGGVLPKVDGVILAAPAVWGRATMPWYQRWALWLGAHSVPWMSVTGQGLGILPSDNIEMLVALGQDPLVIKETRIGTLYGLVNLMDAGLASASGLTTPALILYGERDQVIPKLPTRRMLVNVPSAARVALYEGGYHMLLRDLPAMTVWKDIAAWIDDRAAPLPSGADKRDVARLLGEDD
ncbi:MAG: alpha/beta hydrolase [Rhodospirillaceae bacterium]|nr:alpha/beta hydrolase [Rhodospirillaceae bacterium]